MRSQEQTGPFRVRLATELEGKKWVRGFDLPFAPFPGMGIRVDTYEVLNVVTVLVDDLNGGVTCVVAGDDSHEFTAKKLTSLGFAECEPSGERTVQTASPCRVSVITFASGQQWSKECVLPFPPFNGLHLRADDRTLLRIGTIVVGDGQQSEVECFASFQGGGADTVTDDECEALGFERDYR